MHLSNISFITWSQSKKSWACLCWTCINPAPSIYIQCFNPLWHLTSLWTGWPGPILWSSWHCLLWKWISSCVDHWCPLCWCNHTAGSPAQSTRQCQSQLHHSAGSRRDKCCIYKLNVNLASMSVWQPFLTIVQIIFTNYHINWTWMYITCTSIHEKEITIW